MEDDGVERASCQQAAVSWFGGDDV